MRDNSRKALYFEKLNLLDTKYMQDEAKLRGNASLKSVHSIRKEASTSMTKMVTPETMNTPTRKVSISSKNIPLEKPLQISMKMNIVKK